MPVSKNKPTTLSPDGSMSQSCEHGLPEQEAFRQHLRPLAVSTLTRSHLLQTDLQGTA